MEDDEIDNSTKTADQDKIAEGKRKEENICLSVMPRSKPNVGSTLAQILEQFVEDVENKINKQTCKIDELKEELSKMKFDENIEKLILQIIENRFEENKGDENLNLKAIDYNKGESTSSSKSKDNFDDIDENTAKLKIKLKALEIKLKKSNSLENLKKFEVPSDISINPTNSSDICIILEDLKRSLDSKLNYQTNKIDSLANQVSELSDTLNICSNQYAILLNKYISRAVENQTVINVQPTNKERLSSCKVVEEDGKALFRPECGEDDRESWDSKLTFLLATVGYAVGLGNVWRFPYLAQKNGGGAFLIPYMIMLAIEGIPIFYLELAIGQRLRKGAIGVWSQVSPFLGGIGISSAVVSFNVALYYNTIIAWCLFYFVQSFQAQLPWAECPKKYYQNGSYTLEPECVASTPTQYFWYRTTLEISESIDNPESFNWRIAFSLLIAWILVYMCMIKGIASSGKVVYVTATFPYIVLIIFFFRGITLKGFSDGVKHLFTPKWYKLWDPVVWLEAGTQIFFSLGLGFGGLIAFSSYNPVNNNCYRDAILVSLTNCFTSMFAGIVVFSIIGFKATLNYEKCLAERNNTLNALFGSTEPPPNFDTSLLSTSATFQNLPECDLEKELDNSASGTGLAFIIFTEAINQFPGAQFWAVLFFLMLFTLGIDSQFGTLEGVVTSIVDMKLFPNLRKEILTGIMCLICFLISLSFSHGAGNYVFVLFDNFAGNFPLLIIALCECLAISYVYGLKRFADDVELMVGNRPGLYWLACWKYISPAAMILILIASVAELVVDGSGYDAWRPDTGDTVRKQWPTWALVLISCLILVAIIWIPLVAICRAFGIYLIDDSEKAWFPARDLKEFHGIVEHEVTTAETYLFCIHSDGSEGLCCRTYPPREDDDDDD